MITMYNMRYYAKIHIQLKIVRGNLVKFPDQGNIPRLGQFGQITFRIMNRESAKILRALAELHLSIDTSNSDFEGKPRAHSPIRIVLLMNS